MKRIELTKGKYALVDDEDYDYLNQFRWKASNGNKSGLWYASRTQYVKGNKNSRHISMHRTVMRVIDLPLITIDHIDHNSLNNQKSNLRICTPSQNTQNSRQRTNTASLYKGVIKEKRGKREYWRARIKVGDKHMSLGYFNDRHLAAVAYNNAAKIHFGEFACLNNIEPEYKPID